MWNNADIDFLYVYNILLENSSLTDFILYTVATKLFYIALYLFFLQFCNSIVTVLHNSVFL